MQGLKGFVPTEVKASYINSLLQVGFHTIDFGSFVSPRHIPQMRDTADVLARLELNGTGTRLLSIVANERGAREALAFDEISFLGFPFSISETFQRRNTNASISDSLETVKVIYDLCRAAGRELVVYLSMAFGNPYGDEWNTDIAGQWTNEMAGLGIRTISLADTVGMAREADIRQMFASLAQDCPDVEFGAHLHCKPGNWLGKVQAAWDGGCRRFDSVMRGMGGCPMAEDELVGNLATENLVQFLEEKNVETGLDKLRFNKALEASKPVFV